MVDWRVVLFAKAKTTYIKILQKRRKVLWTEHFDEVENKPKYSVIIAKHAHGKGLNFFPIFYKREGDHIAVCSPSHWWASLTMIHHAI